MPEGPEIRLAADRVARILVGQPIVEANFGLPDLRRFAKKLIGTTVTAVDTRGKAMLTRFDNGLTLYSHNQLYGRWYTTRERRMPQTGRQLRVALHTPTHSALLYSASDIEVLTDRQLSRHPFLLRIGPDILDPQLTLQDIVDRLGIRQFCNRALGSLYLDQSFLAGVGNYLRSEILWAASVNPARKPCSLDSAILRSVARETLRISKRSYRNRGVTVAPRLARELKASGKAYENYRFNVYGRDGELCYRCDTAIARRLMGSRSLFVCGSCQPH
ncbi:MAG: endonuclease VIII [Gammaproteobacteria bacterium]|nr:endonuclease VIII [Gammaproteobacteria bacterium]